MLASGLGLLPTRVGAALRGYQAWVFRLPRVRFDDLKREWLSG